MPDYAKIAYEAWAKSQGWQDGDHAVIPSWALLEQDLKDAWAAAIEANRRSHLAAMNAQIPGEAP